MFIAALFIIAPKAEKPIVFKMHPYCKFVSELHFFLLLSNIPLYGYTTFCYPLTADGNLGCFHLLAVMK